VYHQIFAEDIVRRRHTELVAEAEASKKRRLARRESPVRRSWNFVWRRLPDWQFAH
jgi:hypothetical protein